jgi:hypothetical protein
MRLTPPLTRQELRQPPAQHRHANPHDPLHPRGHDTRLQTIYETRHVGHDVDSSRTRVWHLRCLGRLSYGYTFQDFESYEEEIPGFCAAGFEVHPEDGRGGCRFEE